MALLLPTSLKQWTYDYTGYDVEKHKTNSEFFGTKDPTIGPTTAPSTTRPATTSPTDNRTRDSPRLSKAHFSSLQGCVALY